jgi:hypothetical protein
VSLGAAESHYLISSHQYKFLGARADFVKETETSQVIPVAGELIAWIILVWKTNEDSTGHTFLALMQALGRALAASKTGPRDFLDSAFFPKLSLSYTPASPKQLTISMTAAPRQRRAWYRGVACKCVLCDRAGTRSRGLFWSRRHEILQMAELPMSRQSVPAI